VQPDSEHESPKPPQLSRGDERGSIAPPSIPDLVSAELRRWISSGELKPGPLKIAELARRFGVSSVPIREALRRLEAEGFVSFDRNRSVRVNALSIDDLREIFLIRSVLEPLLLSHAVPLLAVSPGILQRLEAQIALMDETISDPAAWRDANAVFHWDMYDVAPLPRLRRMTRALWTAVEPFLRLYVTSPEVLKVSQVEHRQLLDHVRHADADAANVVLREHLAQTLRTVEVRLNELARA
jgi:DNA-binding GntR family transcriptional regulator